MNDHDPGSSRLPTLGRRGGGWVVLQVVILVIAFVAGVWGPRWPGNAMLPLAIAAGTVMVAGAILLFAGGAGLGRQLTPFPRPIPDGALRQDGIYGLVRHPIYGGVLLTMLAWALISSPLALAPWVLGAAFFEFKRRREEAWLAAQHPAYVDYRERVRWAFVPLIW